MSSVTHVIADNTDILTEILYYLPAKPLVRFKSVSKQWLSLISSPHFCRRHTSRNSTAPYINKPAVSGVFYKRTPNSSSTTNASKDCDYDFISLKNERRSSSSSTYPFKSLKFVEDPTGGINILNSCNGLLLCCSSRVIDNACNYYLYNPTSNQYFTLPPLIDAKSSSTILNVNLAFDPRKSPHYKVICLRNMSTNYPFSSSYCQIDIYTSEDNIWRKCGDPFIPPYHMIFSNGVFSNGAIHWISASGSLLHFKVEEEQLVETCLPCHFGKRRFRYFAESNDHLHLIDIGGPRTIRFDVFEMNKMDFSNWFSKYTVDLDEILLAYPEMVKPYFDKGDFYYAFLILTVVREECEDGGDDESSLLLHIPGKIISYKFKDGSFKTVRDLTLDQSNPALQFGSMDAYHYVETLASVC